MLMTDGSELYLAGPALVKAAIGQQVDPEELGGARMHATLSGTADFREPDDEACIARLRSLIDLLPQRAAGLNPAAQDVRVARNPDDLYNIVPADGHGEYDIHDVIDCIIDADSFQEYKAEFDRMLVTGYARIDGRPLGIVANQKQAGRSPRGEFQIGGVLYPDSVEKAARFVMDCNQAGIPLLFLQDVQGFMVGKAAEQSGIIRSGAKLVNVVSNSVVPKFTVIIGGTFGAGNYALCGKAYDPWLILAWPNARYAVMGPQQAADTLLQLRIRDAQRTGQKLSDEDIKQLRDAIRDQYQEEMDIRHGAARGWVDAIIAPHETRAWIAAALRMIPPDRESPPFRTGVLQV
jgi:acetyl-CoA carboxylase carboxyltransferase component